MSSGKINADVLGQNLPLFVIDKLAKRTPKYAQIWSWLFNTCSGREAQQAVSGSGHTLPDKDKRCLAVEEP